MPRLIALFSYRFDAALVPDLLSNLTGIADAIIYHDDRHNHAPWYNEGEVRGSLIARARDLGAEWALGIDPDERLEVSSAIVIREVLNHRDKAVYGFRLREMWHPDYYRIDGIWGRKRQYRLFPLLPNQEFQSLPVHSPWMPVRPCCDVLNLDLNIYHLKMIDPESRARRRDLYKSLDPERRIQGIGYDYLTDESGLILERIPAGREFIPTLSRVQCPPSPQEPGGRQTILGKWEARYNTDSFPYGDETSYKKAASFLEGHGLVEDWGCGAAWAKQYFTDYRGIDGSGGHADRIADLREYTSQVACVLLRHVLEHNHDWKSVLRNAVRSFTERMVIVICTPFAEETRQIATHWSEIPDYSFNREDIMEELFELEVSSETVVTETVYGVEAIFYISRPHTACVKTELSVIELS
jgi:hypothetical protein